MRLLLLTSLFCAGCAGAATSTASAPSPDAAAPAPCSLETQDGVVSPGRAVAGREFRYCVPATWTATSPRSWLTPSGSISWTPSPRGGARLSQRRPALPARSEVARRNWQEVLEDDIVDFLVTQDDRGRWSTRAEWRRTGLTFSGGAADAGNAEEQVAVYRSVRRAPAVAQGSR